MAAVLFLSLHTLDRMAERHITREEIAQALREPETVYRDKDRPSATIVLSRTDTGRRLKVVVSTSDHEHIITVANRDDER